MPRRPLVFVAIVALSLPVGGAAVAKPVGGCQVFPKSNYWNASVRSLPVDPRSATWLSHMNTDTDLHPDFGRNDGPGPDYGIPITRVTKSHAKVKVRFDYASESDKLKYPLGKDTRIEGGRGSSGDRHAIIVDTSACRLYETWATYQKGGKWYAGSGASWSLKSNKLRPNGWTSADAAGLPILPGLLRWDEVKKGSVDHAIRFTVSETAKAHIWPARHDAGSHPASSGFPPMGARFRLRQGFDLSPYSKETRTVLKAMQRYGLVLADNGSDWYFQGEQSSKWPNRMIAELKTIPADAFEAVDTSSLR